MKWILFLLLHFQLTFLSLLVAHDLLPSPHSTLHQLPHFDLHTPTINKFSSPSLSLLPSISSMASMHTSISTISAIPASRKSSSSSSSFSSLAATSLLFPLESNHRASDSSRRLCRSSACRAMVQQAVQGAPAAYAKEMERLSAKESLLLAVSILFPPLGNHCFYVDIANLSNLI